MKRFICFITYFAISMSVIAFSQKNLNFSMIDLSDHYKAIDKITTEPDSIIKILFEYKLISDTPHYDSSKIEYFNRILPYIKKYGIGEYKIIDDEVDLTTKEINKIMDFNIPIEDLPIAAHIVKIQNVKNKYIQYFYFTINKNIWELFSIQDQSPKEYPNMHIDIETSQKIEMRKIDTNNTEQCKLFNNENYEAIKKLLNNPDSLCNFYSKILQPSVLKEKIEAVKLFVQNTKDSTQELIVSYNHIFLPKKEFSDKTITILNEIELVSPNIPKNSLKFYFMKKDGVWQFYDKKIENYRYFPD
jgi:hypothetical protein